MNEGANVKIDNFHKYDALMYAVIYKHIEIVKILLNVYNKIHIEENYVKNTLVKILRHTDYSKTN